SLFLENQLQCQLNVPWSATTHERIPDADVGCDGDWEKTGASTCYRIDRRSHVGGEARQQGIRKVWVVEDVEDLGSQLQPQLLRDVSVFEDRKVDVVITGTTQSVATQRSEMPCAGNTRTSTA